MSGLIFINYRREESRWSARSLYDRLSASFNARQIFMDIDGIALGEDFVKAIERTVLECDVLIAVIGANWLASKDDLGNRRLDNPEDFVRMEIAIALSRDIRVIPVLMDGAPMPRPTELPDDLKPLVRRNALRISDTSFDGDCQRLVATIKQILEKAAAEEQGQKKDRLDAERREREEKQREEFESSEAQRRENTRLEAENRHRPKRLDREGLESSTAEGFSRVQPPLPLPDIGLQSTFLRFAARFSFVPFGLALLSFLLPFHLERNGFSFLWWELIGIIYYPNNVARLGIISGFVVPLLMLISSFSKYKWKIIPETIVSWIASVSYLLQVLPTDGYRGIGFVLACVFLTAGAIIKSFLLINRLRLFR
jgi:hypothetical protein